MSPAISELMTVRAASTVLRDLVDASVAEVLPDLAAATRPGVSTVMLLLPQRVGDSVRYTAHWSPKLRVGSQRNRLFSCVDPSHQSQDRQEAVPCYLHPATLPNGITGCYRLIAAMLYSQPWIIHFWHQSSARTAASLLRVSFPTACFVATLSTALRAALLWRSGSGSSSLIGYFAGPDGFFVVASYTLLVSVLHTFMSWLMVSERRCGMTASCQRDAPIC